MYILFQFLNTLTFHTYMIILQKRPQTIFFNKNKLNFNLIPSKIVSQQKIITYNRKKIYFSLLKKECLLLL